MALAPLSAGLQSFSPLPIIKLGPSGADSWVGGLVHALGPCEAGSFSYCCLNPHGCFQWEVWGFISPSWSPGLCSLFHSPAVPPILSMHKCGATGSDSIHHVSRSSCVAASPVCPGCPSLPLLPVWMNVSSLSPWLLDFVRFNFLSVLVGFCF